MSEPSNHSSAIATVNAAIACWVIAGIIILFGIFFLVGAQAPPSSTISHAGLLIDATDSSGARGLHNNTTLVIQHDDGSVARKEIKSSLKFEEISKIRNLARSHIGERVVYYTSGPRDARLISARTTSGITIVTAEHALAADRFTGFGMVMFGILMGLVGYYPIRRRHPQ